MSTEIKRVGGLVAAIAAIVALAVPAGASAAMPAGTIDDVDWDVRHSWVDYVTNPAWYLYFGQGTVTRTGGATATAAYGSTSWGGSWTETDYGTGFAVGSDSTAGGVRTVALTGGLDFEMSAHGIDVSLSDVRLVDDGTDELVVVDASYDPLSGSPVQVDDIEFAELVDVGGGPDNQLQLTEDGATVFNGGDNGSYSEGDPFGSLVYDPS